MSELPSIPETDLAILVRARLNELELRQSDFGRIHDFDQGLLSKILHSQVRSLNLESALRLSLGLDVPILTILDAIGRPELYRLLMAVRDREEGEAAVILPSRQRRRRNRNDFAAMEAKAE